MDTPILGENGTLYIGTYFVNGKFYAIGGSNNPPVADAGPNIALDSYQVAGTIIYGTATDPDPNDLLECQWKEGEAVLKDWFPATENGSCDLDLGNTEIQNGPHTLSLYVSDGQGGKASDSMDLAIGNSEPSVAATGTGTYELYTQITLGGEVSDYDGDTLTYKWLEWDELLFSGQVATIYGNTPVPVPEHSINDLTLGLHQLTLSVDDGINDPLKSNPITINIIDSTAPTLQPISNASILWPPNHKMVDISITCNVADNSGGPVTLSAEVASNEPIEGLGDGDTGPDWSEPLIDQTTGTIQLQLRAERGGSGNGRVYYVTITATDQSGNSSEAFIEIMVPHNKRGG